MDQEATGSEHEADQKHAAAMISKNLTNKDQPGRTPGEGMKDDVTKSELHEAEEIRLNRGYEARGNHLSMDRPDLQFSTKKNITSHAELHNKGPTQTRESGKVHEEPQQPERQAEIHVSIA